MAPFFKRRNLIIAGTIVGLISIGAVPRMMQSWSLSKEWRHKSEQTLQVSTTQVEATDSVAKLSLPGTAQAIQTVAVYARVDGFLKQRFVDIGSVVHKGQLLAQLDAPELDQQAAAALAAVEQAKASLESARENLARAKSDEAKMVAQQQKIQTDVTYNSIQFSRFKVLAKEGAVSEADRDQRQQAFNASQADMRAAGSAISAARASVSSAAAGVRVAEAGVKSALAAANRYRAMEGFKNITALFDGTVTKRSVDAGALISASSAAGDKQLFEIANLDRLRIFVNVPEQYIAGIHRDQPVLLSFQAFPGEKFEGRVANIAGGLDSVSKTLQVEVQIDNPGHRLLPGMYAQAQFENAVPSKLAIIPAMSVSSRSDGQYVYALDNANRVHLRKIEINKDLGGRIEVVSGVVPGDTIIVNPPDIITDGMVVHPVRLALVKS